MVFAANQDPALSRVFTTYSASTPQLYLDIDRDKVQTLGIDLSDVFNALQSVLGSAYVNDFNLFGRTWQVNIQGEAVERARIADIYRINVRNKNGDMVPVRAFAEARLVLGPQSVVRYNNFRSVTLLGNAGSRLFVGRRDRRNGAGVRHDPAARVQFRMDGHGAAGKGGGRQDHDYPRAGHGVCLSVPGRAL